MEDSTNAEPALIADYVAEYRVAEIARLRHGIETVARRTVDDWARDELENLLVAPALTDGAGNGN